MVEKHLASCWGTLGVHRDQFLALGSYDNGSGDQFNMTALAIRSAGSTNAVSQLHGEVTRAMFAPMWPGLPEAQRPVSAVTNGVHVPNLDCRRSEQPVHQVSGRRMDRSARRSRPMGRRPGDSGRRIVGRPPVAAPLSVHLHPRARAPALGRGARWHPARRRCRHAARARRADARLRPPLHPATSAPELAFHDPERPRADPERRGTAGADHLRRQVASGRRHRQAPPAARLQARARSDVRAAASRLSTTTICTSLISWCRAATCG